MVKFTKSLEVFLTTHGYLKEYTLISFGHIELFTEKMQKEYMEWLETDEGKSYLEGGKNYEEPR